MQDLFVREKRLRMHPIPAASLLLVVASDAARQPGLGWLEGAGYRVSAATSLKEVEQACHAESFDMVLVADAVEPRMKKAIGLAVRHFLPQAPILQIGRTRPDMEGDCFVTGDSREDVLRSVSQILRRDEIRPAAI
jgi:CheY-like chemotaxis protein